MKLFKYNYFANFANHVGEMWANDKYDIQRHIIKTVPNATGINIWVI